MKKTIVIVAVLVIGLGLIILIYNPDNRTHIGILGDYTTTTTTSSVDAFRAAELAINELNSVNDKYYFTRYDLSSYSNNNKLVDDLEKDGVEVIVGPVTSSLFLSFEKQLKSLEIPIFLIAVSSDKINGQVDNLFRLTDTTMTQVKATIEALDKHIKSEHLSIYYTEINSGYSEPFARDVEDEARALGISVDVIEVGSLEDELVRKQLLQSTESDCSLIIAGAGQAGIIAQLIATNNLDMNILLTSWAKEDRTIEYTRTIENNLYILSSPPAYKTLELEMFISMLNDDENLNYSNSAYYAYEVVYFVDSIIEEVNSNKAKDIINYVNGLNRYSGRFNEFDFDGTGDGGRGYGLMKIVNGDYEYVVEKLN